MTGKIETVTTLVRDLARGLLSVFSAALAGDPRDDDRQLHDTDVIGEYNHRTGRLDAGNDPYGWYDED
ncbi:MAG: hypothetical protein H7A12_14895 [Pseudomonadales bacterium]|nr:hypothetical protein [Pseudomonadales bacterium]